MIDSPFGPLYVPSMIAGACWVLVVALLARASEHRERDNGRDYRGRHHAKDAGQAT